MNTHRRHLSPAERSRSRSAAKSKTPLPATSISAAASPYVKFSQDFGQILNFDAYAGRTYADIYINKINQRKSMFGKLQNGSLNDDMLKNFLTELRHKARRPIWYAYMRTEMNGPAKDERMMAVLDTGCREDRLQPKG